MKRARSTLAAAALLAFAAGASAGPMFGSFDLATFAFDVTSYSSGGGNGLTGNATAAGTSNGVGWSIGGTPSGGTNLWSGRTTTNGSFSFTVLPILTDNLHPSIDFTITFAQPVADLIVALDNDNTTDSINFGLVPWLTQGVTVSGTQLALATPAGGGLAWFKGVNSLTVSHVNNNGSGDGFDLAFHAIPVPEPEAYGLALAGVGVVAVALRRRRRAA